MKGLEAVFATNDAGTRVVIPEGSRHSFAGDGEKKLNERVAGVGETIAEVLAEH